MGDDYTNMEEIDESIDFKLYEHLNADESEMQGGLKSYKPKADGSGSAIYAERKSDYTISAERLLWVDGWEETTIEGDKKVQKQEMTLVVLKIAVSSRDEDWVFRHVSATLEFEDHETGGKDEPEVQAWAPFHELERSNTTGVSIKEVTKTEAAVEGGSCGVKGSASRSHEREISWEQTHFDEAHANTEISSFTQRRNGVTWFVKQNKLQNHGAKPEFWTAVLLSRSSSTAPYLVRFNIRLRAGTTYDLKNKVKRFFGLGSGQTMAFLVNPWEPKHQACNYEGLDIRQSIDLDNLGKLRDPANRTNLRVTWGPKGQSDPSNGPEASGDQPTSAQSGTPKQNL